VPLVTTSDAVQGVVSYIIGRCLLVAAWGHLPARLCRAVCGHLIVGGDLGHYTARLLKCAPEEVVMST
jgi:hypothetical protein